MKLQNHEIVLSTIVKSLFHLILFATISIVNVNSQWIYQTTVPDLGPYPCISVYGPNELVAAGGYINTPKVFRSTDGGLNWIDISGNMTGPKIFSVWAVDENTIFAGDGGSLSGFGGNAKLWKTTNGGLNWEVVLSTGGTDGFFNGIVFSRSNPSFGIAMSDAPDDDFFFVAKTTNQGATWTVQNNTPSGFGLYGVLGTVVCIDSLFYGWGIGPGTAKVIFTTNGGSSWTTKSINSTGSFTTGFAFSNDKSIGIAVGSHSLPFISRSTNEGASWSIINTGLPMAGSEYNRIHWLHGTDICFITSITGQGGCIGKSTNSGLNWTIMSTDIVDGIMAIDGIFTGGSSFGYAVSGYDDILRLQEPIGIHTIGHGIPSEFLLHQNYPNPFNPVTRIRFQMKVSGLVELKIYDLLGREISNLVDEYLSPGVYEIDWNAKNFTSGLYLYQLKVFDPKVATGYSFKETRKMMLIK
jgi:hypothetical protein